MQVNMGMAGEFRCVVKRADGSTKIDTGYQKNLILNQGLDFFGGGKGENMMQYCVIGSGNSQPVYTQNKLDTTIAGVGGAIFSTKYDYDAAKDGNLYKTNRVFKYSFNGLNNVNVSELGLASTYSTTTTYYLCTRALIKDSQGNPTTITVLSGEILEIYYKLWSAYDVTDKTGSLNLLDGVGGSIAYNYKIRLSKVGSGDYVNFYHARQIKNDNFSLSLFNSDLASINTMPTGGLIHNLTGVLSNYNLGSYKIIWTIILDIVQGNGEIRSAVFDGFGKFQIRFGSVANDSPITKTNTQTLTIPVEVSWGRYEGAL